MAEGQCVLRLLHSPLYILDIIQIELKKQSVLERHYMATTNLENEWSAFCSHGGATTVPTHEESALPVGLAPEPTSLYISTKTKIVYLNTTALPLEDIFWKLNVIPYASTSDGVIKKQMKITCTDIASIESVENRLSHIDCARFTTLKGNKDSPSLKMPYVTKINVGICKKDILSQRNKEKGAFYNCFMLVLRVYHEGAFHEVNLKVFNTGKLSFPGMLSQDLLDKSLHLVSAQLTAAGAGPVTHDPSSIDTVLVNSNFSCAFFIDRDALVQLLKYTHRIHVSYDPCSYPGIQCKYFIPKGSVDVGDGVCRCPSSCASKRTGPKCQEVSFMVFRTGSVLIVGRCDEDTLRRVYDKLKTLLRTHYAVIRADTPSTRSKKPLAWAGTPRQKKRKTRTIIVTEPQPPSSTN
jgi:TATA-box binding protein (TBP) (component of TFIID and TFIIIB)